MRDILSGETSDADMTIWTESVVERLDFLFIGNIKNTAHIGLPTTNGANDISRYLNNLLPSLRTQWKDMTDLHQSALGKIMFILTIKQDEANIPFPLLCPSLFTAFEKIYSQYPEALKEVSVYLHSDRVTHRSGLLLRCAFWTRPQSAPCNTSIWISTLVRFADASAKRSYMGYRFRCTYNSTVTSSLNIQTSYSCIHRSST
jgi:hypothetical protein